MSPLSHQYLLFLLFRMERNLQFTIKHGKSTIFFHNFDGWFTARSMTFTNNPCYFILIISISIIFKADISDK